MNYLSVLLLLLLLVQPESRRVSTYSLQEALDQELIRLEEISRTDDHELRLTVENLHKKKDLQIVLEPGLQFASVDTSEQDQLILDGRTLLVRAGSKRSAGFGTYCTQADHLSPRAGSRFTLKPAADGKLLQLARYLSDMRDADYIAQQAVWVITDNHDLRGLHHDDPRRAAEIQTFVAELSGKPRPAYTVRYRESAPGQRAATRESISIHGVHEYDNEREALFTCKIFSESGAEVKEVFKDMRQGRGHVRFSFHLETTRLPRGKYVSRVFKEGELFQEIWVES